MFYVCDFSSSTYCAIVVVDSIGDLQGQVIGSGLLPVEGSSNHQISSIETNVKPMLWISVCK